MNTKFIVLKHSFTSLDRQVLTKKLLSIYLSTFARGSDISTLWLRYPEDPIFQLFLPELPEDVHCVNIQCTSNVNVVDKADPSSMMQYYQSLYF